VRPHHRVSSNPAYRREISGQAATIRATVDPESANVDKIYALMTKRPAPVAPGRDAPSGLGFGMALPRVSTIRLPA